MTEAAWYYAEGEKQNGPLPLSELKRLATEGTIAPETLVWGPGLASWSRAESVPGLMPSVPSPPTSTLAEPQLPPPAAASTPEPPPETERIPEGDAKVEGRQLLAEGLSVARDPESMPPFRLVQGVLDLFRRLLPPARLRNLDRKSRMAGHLAYLLTGVLLIVYRLTLGIKNDSVAELGLALLVIPVVLVGHYVAVRFLGAGKTLLRRSSSRVASVAFLETSGLIALVYALIAFLGGLFMLISGGAQTIFGGALLGVAFLMVYVTASALNPEVLNIRVGEDAGAGVEAIGIFMFLIKLPVVLMPVLFGVGAVLGLLGSLYLNYMAVFEFEAFAFGAGPVLDSVWRFGLGIAFFPFGIYLNFLLFYLFLEVLLAVLDVPGSLEGIRETLESRPNEKPAPD